MFPPSQSGGPNQQNVDMNMHCILVAASNPYPLQTPVYVPQLQSLEKTESIDSNQVNQLYDAEAVAKAFPQVLCFIYFIHVALCLRCCKIINLFTSC
jgi:mediator of RNA polymerase II transcription subunit 25